MSQRAWAGVVLVLTVLVLLGGDVSAAGRGRRLTIQRFDAQARPTLPPTQGTARSYGPYQYYRDLYPKYHGGFHARELQNLGVPSGDIGLRGNGISWTPW